MRAHFGLPSVEKEEVEGRPPIGVKFEIPYFTVSGIQVREVGRVAPLLDLSGFPALPSLGLDHLRSLAWLISPLQSSLSFPGTVLPFLLSAWVPSPSPSYFALCLNCVVSIPLYWAIFPTVLDHLSPNPPTHCPCHIFALSHVTSFLPACAFFFFKIFIYLFCCTGS